MLFFTYMLSFMSPTDNALAEVDILFQASPTTSASAAAKFIRAAASLDLIITDIFPCYDGSGQPAPSPTATNSENAGNPTQASLCSDAAIETTDTTEWFNYGVSSPLPSQ